MNTASTDTPRIWGGTTLATRQKARREKLVEVGLDLLGTPGATLSVRAACRSAQLTERYFYESFPDRDALVLAVYEELADEVRQVLDEAASEGDPAEVARRSIEALVTLMVDDRRKGRVLLVAPLTEAVLAQPSQALLPALGELIRSKLPRSTPAEQRTLISVGLLGSLTALFYAYLEGGMQVTREQLVDHCIAVLNHAGHLAG
ncbi:TetR/AcrR family transcriptional regulator [Nocardioides sp. HDW12B]|uniref:TetR/AcrR family transcriptional regulator n=1 Tax=Nocardioides sp. HDW12B TaxID=2714939 RepID=UPI00140D0DCD|nr:TetR/AcrR family transcriptional regulator [Nocardioides sp. HDW12B]QIK67910.1 TetR/AcrR family transcriptional regulator [Nocardioides sp. HDW12B]